MWDFNRTHHCKNNRNTLLRAHKMEYQPQTPTLFEASWEVCNMCGGIYTVITTKAKSMLEHYKNYFLIGPYLGNNNLKKFEQLPPTPKLKAVFAELDKQGIKCIYGRWLIDGSPEVVLIDFKNIFPKLPGIKTFLWEKYQVDSLLARYDFDEPVAWSWAVGEFIKIYVNQNPKEQPIAHFHEWLCGGALLNIKHSAPHIPCVFTTHATMLGRTITGNYRDLFNELESLHPDDEAKHYNIAEKHTMEKACAHNADAFTTVSELTGIETEKILAKKPDVILPNGINVEHFPYYEDLSLLHRKTRDKMREFLLYYFMPYYKVDVENTLLFFISGRYEHHNKGIDVLIKALGRLNEKLKQENYEKNIVVFFLIPSGTHGVRFDVLESKAVYTQLSENLHEQCKEIETKLKQHIATLELFTKEDILSRNFMRETKILINNIKRDGLPPTTTHNINNEQNDSIMREIVQNGLDNEKSDKIKVINYPVYIKGDDGILNLSYFDMVAGFHLGIFPSTYEPWGYTPLECGTLGVPAITSDQSGFGRYVKKTRDGKKGIFVLNRYSKSEEDIIEELTQELHKFSKLTQQERTEQKIVAKEICNLCDWKTFSKNYTKAHRIAINKVKN